MNKEVISLDGMDVEVRIIPKNNKNTYFKFKKDGTIDITKSKYQSKKEILKYMKSNAKAFKQKLEKVTVQPVINEGEYSYFGQILTIHYIDTLNVRFDIFNNVVELPNKEIDPERTFLRKTERNILLYEVEDIKNKYINNGFVSIDNITIKTRHTKTRFGSCNATRRTINLNTNLIHYDKKYLEYVFLHEIAHLTHQNHSKEYYQLLEQLCPNYKVLRKELREIYR